MKDTVQMINLGLFRPKLPGIAIITHFFFLMRKIGPELTLVATLPLFA